MPVRNIGLKVAPPSASCSDPRCPFHGRITIRGKLREGVIIKYRSPRTAVLQIDYLHFVRKYQRYERRRSRIHVHVPPCIEVKEGDRVLVGECRPLAKTVAHVVLEKR
jgi:small subunit ribosomal protein S17